MENKNIVSVAVITYNSAETIIEALNSVSGQTYKGNIELVISDDCSTDNTVSIIKAWLAENEKYFYSVSLLEAKKNLGITANINKVSKACSGEFIKYLSGDDKLYDSHSISKATQLIGNKSFLFTPPSIFGCVDASNLSKLEIERFNLFSMETCEQQLKDVASCSKKSPKIVGVFFRNKILAKMGYFDEKYSMMEDYPFMIRIFRDMRQECFFSNEILYSYRVRDGVDHEFLFSKRKIEHVKSINMFREDIILPLFIQKKWYKLYIITWIKLIFTRLEVSNSYMGKMVFKLRKLLQKF
ncbi:glycosyltransferase [Francisella tularensis subsp. novicida]|uniref:glycosyltransferase n=1 Tax=Francisella tularensis TaxID=263 RepID=UPI00050407A2|nr:glycosyltransferase [Francisella tularensis]AJJ46717.1 glycosyltransferase like 2 family protein [Francisella tularensis subsp. novicida]KFJ66516.1 glycosyl transferase 2 family protein [Francisella tularensis subsp. novicida]MBK2343865.1 glycosyltransferase [Francisella tularensis subsp. novicida]MBK2349150.1 glycosyltransferase [Francisella tularensis subsp. novicida]MBK2352710.1 glycosyltransferase [Francisella tularensis subsp. novicida]